MVVHPTRFLCTYCVPGTVADIGQSREEADPAHAQVVGAHHQLAQVRGSRAQLIHRKDQTELGVGMKVSWDQVERVAGEQVGVPKEDFVVGGEGGGCFQEARG